MARISESPHTVRFGVYELNLQSAQLKKHGLRIKLQRQPAQILVLLVTKPGEVVTREQLRAHLWREDTFVDFDHGLNNAINRIRDVLCDSPSEPHFIETIPRTGYRFIGKLEEVREVLAFPSTVTRIRPEAEASKGVVTRPLRLGRMAAFATVLGLTLGMGGGMSKASRQAIHSLVVLPFENLSGDASQDYFADGMTDSLITDLARLGSFDVISRTSAMHYKGVRTTLPEIARELNVDAVIEGGVVRSGGRVRISAQLIEASSDRHLWAHAYDRDAKEVLSLQREVVQSIVQEIQAKLAGQESERVAPRPTSNMEAYEAFLKGQFFARQPDGPESDRGWEYLKQATALDPNFALAHAALADAYSWDDDTLENSRQEAEKALSLDDTLAGAHTALAWVKNRADWDFQGAEKEYRRALDLNPRYAEAHEGFGYFLADQGRLSEAFAELEAARHLDPISPKLNILYGLVLYCDHRYDEALTKFQKALELAPGSVAAQRHIFRVYEQKGDFESAINMYTAAAPWWGEDPSKAVTHAEELRKAYADLGASGYWRKRLEIETRTGKEHDKFRVSLMYVHLGQADHALDLLEQLYKEHNSGLPMWLRSDPQYDAIRREPRYQTLLRKMGLRSDNTEQ